MECPRNCNNREPPGSMDTLALYKGQWTLVGLPPSEQFSNGGLKAEVPGPQIRTKARIPAQAGATASVSCFLRLYSPRFSSVLRLEPAFPDDGQRSFRSLRKTHAHRNSGQNCRGAGEQPVAQVFPVSFDANDLLRRFLLEWRLHQLSDLVSQPGPDG